MWNLSFTDPIVINATVLTRLPDTFRKKRESEWSRANKPGLQIDSFLEGPAFDRSGNLLVTDIPNGRIFSISATLEWRLIAEYEGWPNGLAIHRDGAIWIADYRRGLLKLDAQNGHVETILANRNSESFKGLNDLTFDQLGNCYFTDQGQTGLHDPSGRVYRLQANGALECLLQNVPSPNGIALDVDEKALLVAVTRANAVWRGPLLPDRSISKVGAFRTFFGTSGPDGMAVDNENRVVVAHASLGGAFVVNPRGEVTHFIRSPAGSTVTNVAFRPGSPTIVMTESETGAVLEAQLPAIGAKLYSHL